MSRMAELMCEIQELVEQGLSAKFIATTLAIPIRWVEDVIDDIHYQELQQEFEMTYVPEQGYDEDYDYGESFDKS